MWLPYISFLTFNDHPWKSCGFIDSKAVNINKFDPISVQLPEKQSQLKVSPDLDWSVAWFVPPGLLLVTSEMFSSQTPFDGSIWERWKVLEQTLKLKTHFVDSDGLITCVSYKLFNLFFVLTFEQSLLQACLFTLPLGGSHWKFGEDFKTLCVPHHY